MAAHQAPLSLGFSRQEHWSGLPFPSPMHESEKWKWSRSVVSDPQRSHGLQPSRLLHPWDFPGKSTGVGCHCLLLVQSLRSHKSPTLCHPTDCSTPGFPVLHCLPEFAQTHVHWVSDAIQLSHPLLPPSPFVLNLSRHQGLVPWKTIFPWTRCWRDGFRMIQVHYIHCALDFYYYDISSTSHHQALDPGGWGPLSFLQGRKYNSLFYRWGNQTWKVQLLISSSEGANRGPILQPPVSTTHNIV